MIKAVFFDWFNTLAYHKPPREELHTQALQEFGIEVSPEHIRQGLLIADRDYFEENARLPIPRRSPEERDKVWVRYESTIVARAGVEVGKELLLPIMKRVQELASGTTFALFDDVLPTMGMLKRRPLILGLISNFDRDMKSLCVELGLEPYLDFAITSAEVGVSKPERAIFLAALQRAGVDASEAVHVGDQYKLDVVGARGAGIAPILIDRLDLYPEVIDCPRIRCLAELEEHIR